MSGSILENIACVVCGDNNEVLMPCDDQQNRCPPCCIDAGYCLSCGIKIGSGGNPQLGLCFFCMPGGVADWADQEDDIRYAGIE